jgi:hypothetical protein
LDRAQRGRKARILKPTGTACSRWACASNRIACPLLIDFHHRFLYRAESPLTGGISASPEALDHRARALLDGVDRGASDWSRVKVAGSACRD